MIHRVSDILRLNAGEALPERTLKQTALLRQTVSWAQTFLCRPSSAIGRPGAVCPWTAPSIRSDLFMLTIEDKCLTESEVQTAMRRYLDVMLRIAPVDAGNPHLRTILVLMPQFADPSVCRELDRFQSSLKDEFVRIGLMIGQFYPTCQEPGLRNPAFRPLQAPTGMLVLREMVLSDLPFLTGKTEWLQAYVTNFGNTGRYQLVKGLQDNRTRWSQEVVRRVSEVALEASE